MSRLFSVTVVTVFLAAASASAATPGTAEGTYLERLAARQARLQQVIEHSNAGLATTAAEGSGSQTANFCQARLELLQAMSANLALRRERILKEAARPAPIRVRRKAARLAPQAASQPQPVKVIDATSPAWPAEIERARDEMMEQRRQAELSVVGARKSADWMPDMAPPSPSTMPTMDPAPTPGIPTTGGEGRTDSPR